MRLSDAYKEQNRQLHENPQYGTSGAKWAGPVSELYVLHDCNSVLDYGCGKGRVVALAAMHPFGRVIGVELNHELIAIARNNLGRIEPKAQCKRVELFQSDATEFKVPDRKSVV